MDIQTAHTSQDSKNNGRPPTDALEVTDDVLKSLFIKQQIDTWGFDQVEEWFNAGYDVMVINGKVIWVK